MVRGLAALAAAVSLLVAGSGAAQADSEWYWGDGFEGSPSQTWSFDWGGHFEIDQGTARIGKNDAYLPANDDFVSVGTTITPPESLYWDQSYYCEATVWVKGIYENGRTSSSINFEIIDKPTWTYMGLKQATIGTGRWQKLAVSWSSGDRNPRIRVSLLKNSAPIRVDDLEVACNSWTIR